MPRYIEFVCESEPLIARAVLLDEDAPKTCELVWSILPTRAPFHHAIYSGAELAMVLSTYHEIGLENATTAFLPFELGFTSLRAADYFDVKQDFSEFMFFYDRNNGPRMLDGLVRVNLFARFVDNQDKLYELAHRIRLEGRKQFTVRRAE
jgi:hypothetical protein